MQGSKVAVIGAGAAGIGAARRLVELGFEVEVFEKSRGYGGRCATRRWNGCVLDHGAQYWTMRDGRFRERVEQACGAGLFKMERPVREGVGGPFLTGERFYHRDGNARLWREMAVGLTVHLECPVVPERLGRDRWRVGGREFARVVATAPLPQVLGWFGLEGGGGPGEGFAPCLAAWFLFEGEPEGRAAEVYGMQAVADEEVGWTACENHKVGRVPSGQTLLLAHGSERFSRAFVESEPEVWVERMAGAVRAWWGLEEAEELGRGWHRWRYARVVAEGSWGEVCLSRLPSGLTVVGDGVAGHSRVETAWLSGWEVELG